MGGRGRERERGSGGKEKWGKEKWGEGEVGERGKGRGERGKGEGERGKGKGERGKVDGKNIFLEEFSFGLKERKYQEQNTYQPLGLSCFQMV